MYPVIVLSCDWSEIESSWQFKESNVAEFDRLSYLNEWQTRCPNNARLKLEIGEQFYQLGQFESAIEIWQGLLNNNELPTKVALKLRLRILETRRRVLSRYRSQLVFRTAWHWDEEQQGSYIDLSLAGKISDKQKARDVNGSALWLVPYLKYKGSLRHYVDPNVQAYLVQSEIGLDTRFKNIRWPMGVSLKLQDQSNEVSLVMNPAVKLAPFQLNVVSEYNVSDQVFQWQPEVRYKDGELEILVLSQANYEKELEFNYSYARIRFGNVNTIQWGGSLKDEPSLNDRTSQVFFNKSATNNITVGMLAETNLLNTNHWHVGASLKWTIAK
jgi:hypothetical protein